MRDPLPRGARAVLRPTGRRGRRLFLRLLVGAVLLLLSLGGILLLLWRIILPVPLVGQAAQDTIARSFVYTAPPTFTQLVGQRSVFGIGTYLLAEPDYHFVIGISTGLNDRQALEYGVLPDINMKTDWTLTDTSTIQVRGQPVTLYRYTGLRSDQVDVRGWVVQFQGDDGIVKLNIMGPAQQFHEADAWTFLASVR